MVSEVKNLFQRLGITKKVEVEGWIVEPKYGMLFIKPEEDMARIDKFPSGKPTCVRIYREDQTGGALSIFPTGETVKLYPGDFIEVIFCKYQVNVTRGLLKKDAIKENYCFRYISKGKMKMLKSIVSCI